MAEMQSLLRSAELVAEGADPLAAILAGSHPLMVEAFYLAAIPQWYDVALLDALRLRDDGREEGLVERLARYSFVVPLSGTREGHQAYCIRSLERTALQRRWIAEDATAYRAAHARALAFWREHADPNPFAQAQNTLYHLLFVDFQQGIELLLERFRTYRNEHHLPAIERLLDTAREAQSYLALLEHEIAATFQDLITYLGARLAQLRGAWPDAAAAMGPLFARFDTLEPSLRPYLLRARAYDLAHQGHYARAIEALKQALKEFKRPAVAGSRWGIIEAERGYTLIALGDAYVDLAAAASGRGTGSPYHETGDQRQESLWTRLRPALYFVVSLPLVLYLSFTLGRRAWHPRFWPALIGLDWIVARLMATGARCYRRADPILESHGKAAEGLLADEKLAALYLHLGDASAAERLCRWLLTQEGYPLGPYRQALVHLMLGDALLSLGRPHEARGPLREAQSVLDDYVDNVGQARALELLGKALLGTGQQAEAMLHLAAASLRYQEAERWIDATRLAEGLDVWLQSRPALGPAGDKAADVVRRLRQRQYPGDYRHPVLLFFRQFILASLPLLLLFLPLLSIILDTSSALRPVMHLQPLPILSVSSDDAPVLISHLEQGIQASNVSSAIVSSTLQKLTAGLILAYLLASLFLGLAAILFTPLWSIEARGQKTTVFLDEHGLALGRPGDQLRPRLRWRLLDRLVQAVRRTGDREIAPGMQLLWSDVDCLIEADVCLWEWPLEDRSAFAVVAGGQRLMVGGLRAWYSSLRKRVADELSLPAGRPILDLNFQIFPSRLGWLYVANLILVLILWIVAASPDETLVLLDLPGTSYSAVDFYPYLFLGLVLVPLWWGVFQPTRQRIGLRPHSRLPLVLLGVGLILLGIQVLLHFRPLLTVVDPYLPLVTITLLLTGEWALWHARLGEKRAHAAPLRLGTAAAVLAACLLLTTVMVRDVRAYHALVQGNTLRDRAEDAKNLEERKVLLQEATGAYGRAALLGSSPIWELDTRPAAGIRIGVPSPRRFPWILGLTSEGVMLVADGLHAEAIAAFSETLRYAPQNEGAYTSRALARLSLAGQMAGAGEVEPAAAQYRRAIDDLQEASDLNPQSARYYLWLGLSYNALSQLFTIPGEKTTRLDLLAEAHHYFGRALTVGSQAGGRGLDCEEREVALLAMGWVAYARQRYGEALANFEDAMERDPEICGPPKEAGLEPYEARLAQGYALYGLERFDEARIAWEQAEELDPGSLIALFSLGTLHWRLGRETGHDRCTEYQRAAAYFERVADQENLSAQARVNPALACRTAAQIRYLLGNCAGYDKLTCYQQAVTYYDRAVKLDPRGLYWHRKGRLSYAIADILHKAEPARAQDWLQRAIRDLDRAIEASPLEPIYLHDQAWMLYLAWAWSDARGVTEHEGLLRARADLLAALALDPTDRDTSYRPNFWLATVEPEAVAGTLALGDARRDAGDDTGAVAFYELVADYLPEEAQGAFSVGLGHLVLGDGEGALEWYAEGLRRAAAAGDVSSPEEALVALYLAITGGEALPAAPVLALFEAHGIQPGVHDPLVAFQLSVAALRAGNLDEHARLSNLGLELAVAAGDITPTRPGAALLRDYLIQHPEVDVAKVYWPLWEDLPAREQAVASQPRAHLYWRYRAELGFRLLGDRKLMLAREESDRDYELIMATVARDVERAYALNPGEHQVWRDFFVDGNIGWIYLRRGDDRIAEDPARALADYKLAAVRIRPRSKNAALDLTEALFKAGHTALRLGEIEQADRLYDRALDLLHRSGEEFGLEAKVPDAIAALESLAAEDPTLTPQITPLLQALENYR